MIFEYYDTLDRKNRFEFELGDWLIMILFKHKVILTDIFEIVKLHLFKTFYCIIEQGEKQTGVR